MIVSINQPAYLPWLGYFDRVARSDLHIVLDNVQLEHRTKTAFTNRNRVRTKEGWGWLTVPVKTAGLDQPLINAVEIDNTRSWAQKHWRTLLQAYAHAPHFAQHRAFFESYYRHPWVRLDDLLRQGTAYLLDALGIATPVLYSSEMGVEGCKSELILNLCQEAGATHYLSGPFGRGYLDMEAFERAGISIDYHDYVHPRYPQAHPGFEPYMSVVDLMFNCGEESLDVLRSGADLR